MSKLSQWAEADDAVEDDNLLWDDDAEKKLAENHGGIHLRRRSPPLNVVTPPPAPTTPPVVKKSVRKTTKFTLGERALASPSAPAQKLKYRSLHGTSKRTTKGGCAVTTSRLSTSSVSSTSSGQGGTVAQIVKTADSPEQIRRFLLAEVKQMSIERLVADAKRFAFLEAYYSSHQEPTMQG